MSAFYDLPEELQSALLGHYWHATPYGRVSAILREGIRCDAEVSSAVGFCRGQGCVSVFDFATPAPADVMRSYSDPLAQWSGWLSGASADPRCVVWLRLDATKMHGLRSARQTEVLFRDAINSPDRIRGAPTKLLGGVEACCDPIAVDAIDAALIVHTYDPRRFVIVEDAKDIENKLTEFLEACPAGFSTRPIHELVAESLARNRDSDE